MDPKDKALVTLGKNSRPAIIASRPSLPPAISVSTGGRRHCIRARTGVRLEPAIQANRASAKIVRFSSRQGSSGPTTTCLQQCTLFEPG